MKYSLRSLMIVAIAVPPVLAWWALPLFFWLTTPQPFMSETGAADWSYGGGGILPMKPTIHHLVLVTVILAILAAWWLDRSRLAKEVRRLTPQHHDGSHGPTH